METIIVLLFKDGTKQRVITSLNKEYLESLGVKYKKDFVWDIEKQRYIYLSQDIEEVLVLDERLPLDEVSEALQAYL